MKITNSHTGHVCMCVHMSTSKRNPQWKKTNKKNGAHTQLTNTKKKQNNYILTTRRKQRKKNKICCFWNICVGEGHFICVRCNARDLYIHQQHRTHIELEQCETLCVSLFLFWLCHYVPNIIKQTQHTKHANKNPIKFIHIYSEVWFSDLSTPLKYDKNMCIRFLIAQQK